MGQALRPSSLVPRGFVFDAACGEFDTTLITVRPLSMASACPGCGTRSGRIHSRYQRRFADLPFAGKPVRLVVLVRRFHCDAVLCGRRIFAERFDEHVLAPWARRTARLDDLVHYLGLVLGGRPAASFAQRLMLPVSNDTLLRVVLHHHPGHDPTSSRRKLSSRRRTWTNSRLPRLPMRASRSRRKVANSSGRFQPTSGAA